MLEAVGRHSLVQRHVEAVINRHRFIGAVGPADRGIQVHDLAKV